jgi:hypothetical protein
MILADAAERMATAYHEAGHAVMALLLGREPKGASIQRRGDVAGFVDFDKDFPASTLSYFDKSEAKRIYFEMRVMITVAGTGGPHQKNCPAAARRRALLGQVTEKGQCPVTA